jgi:hypothetical protein
MDTSDKWFTLDHHGGPIWGSTGREFKSRQPDVYNYLGEEGYCANEVAGARHTSWGPGSWLGGFAVLGSVLRLQIDLQDHLITEREQDQNDCRRARD